MKDCAGDKIAVEIVADRVYLDVYYGEDDFNSAVLTPKKARKLARKLNDAANEVEGVEPIGYTLTLTEDQAKTLAAIFYRIGGTAGFAGSPVTARKYVEQMRKQLNSLGVYGEDVDDVDPRFAIDEGNRAIYFIGVAE